MVPVAVTVFSTVYSPTTWVRMTNSLFADFLAFTISIAAIATATMPKIISHILLFFFIISVLFFVEPFDKLKAIKLLQVPEPVEGPFC